MSQNLTRLCGVFVHQSHFVKQDDVLLLTARARVSACVRACLCVSVCVTYIADEQFALSGPLRRRRLDALLALVHDAEMVAPLHLVPEELSCEAERKTIQILAFARQRNDDTFLSVAQSCQATC